MSRVLYSIVSPASRTTWRCSMPTCGSPTKGALGSLALGDCRVDAKNVLLSLLKT
jgi:hypothetical protein